MVTFKDERIATIVFCCKQGATISHFEREKQAQSFSIKKAYIANGCKPIFRSSQAVRMQRFFDDTGYSLRIENRIKDL